MKAVGKIVDGLFEAGDGFAVDGLEVGDVLSCLIQLLPQALILPYHLFDLCPIPTLRLQPANLFHQGPFF